MSTPPEKNPGRDTPQDCPWALHPATGEHERLSPPAPMIELDTPEPSAPVKPLGPRRLARLQREMAEHAREIQESERARGGGVDDALLAKQQRLADLAVRAAAANERDRRDAERAVAKDPSAGASTSETASPGATESGEPEAPEKTAATGPSAGNGGSDGAPGGFTVTFPGSVARGSDGIALSSGGVDPGAWPTSSVDYGPGLETTQIPIYTAPVPAGQTEPHREPAPTGDPATPHDSTSAPVGQDRPGTGPLAAADGGTATGAGERAPGEAPSSSPGAPSSSSETPSPVDDTHHAPPGQPVRAVDAEGLDLLAPDAYRKRSTGLRWLLALLLVVIAALVVVLVMFIL